MDDAALARWLRQREHADWRSRSLTLTTRVTASLPQDRPIRVVDLATGDGSNLRYLLPFLPSPQSWLVVDRSQALLSQVQERTRVWAAARGVSMQTARSGFRVTGSQLDCCVEERVQDLGTLNDLDIFSGRHLVTASALLDLVSETWLQALAAHCRRSAAVALFAITYDGRFTCDPPEPEDDMIRRAMNEHQRRDKGLGGLAQGPHATDCARRCFAAEGYMVATAPSDWALGPDDADMQRSLIDGWAEAASEVRPSEAPVIEEWRARRLAHVDAARSRVVVGHHDLAAWPE
jgi:hypothetical protein